MSRKLQNTPIGSCKSFKSCYSFPCILVHYHLENLLIKVTFIRTYGYDASCLGRKNANHDIFSLADMMHHVRGAI